MYGRKTAVIPGCKKKGEEERTYASQQLRLLRSERGTTEDVMHHNNCGENAVKEDNRGRYALQQLWRSRSLRQYMHPSKMTSVPKIIIKNKL